MGYLKLILQIFLYQYNLTELILLNNRFKHCFNINNTEKEIFFFKLSITQEPKIRSLRRPIEDILMREL